VGKRRSATKFPPTVYVIRTGRDEGEHLVAEEHLFMLDTDHQEVGVYELREVKRMKVTRTLEDA
jgi:hypothetical protein